MREKLFQIRVNDAEKASIDGAASRAGERVSEWGRRVLLEATESVPVVSRPAAKRPAARRLQESLGVTDGQLEAPSTALSAVFSRLPGHATADLSQSNFRKGKAVKP